MAEKGKHAGRSIIERLWEQMDIKYDALMVAGTYDHEVISNNLVKKSDRKSAEAAATDLMESLKLQGQCTGLCYAITVMQYPYDDVKEGMDKVRAEARERYLANLGEDDSDEYEDEDSL